ncbi:gypsy retrotransposon integrase-like protein 1 [Plakobranchus ocellatus]|uniref:Gypsy retrotransposon integrase-like protein 1 n=1 Tax=Plakobranchus ocellatus TaxID=259542 RepID=A0AAV3ZFT9_9GAST|nr:gypsy retrotransposon integrase-like protein 1 [Plakobranchus ocellatus]
MEKVLNNIYWPPIDGAVTRFCPFYDVYQRTVRKGITPRVALEKVSNTYTPFKRVAIDIISPINSSSDAGHRLILTLVDCAIRHAEAVVPFRKIDDETVAESLVNTYIRLDGPEEVLGDQGTQFMIDCMKEVLRVLGIKKKANDETPTDDVFESAASLATVEDDDEGCSCEVSPELGGWVARRH